MPSVLLASCGEARCTGELALVQLMLGCYLHMRTVAHIQCLLPRLFLAALVSRFLATLSAAACLASASYSERLSML
jgi:hypothetical protein